MNHVNIFNESAADLQGLVFDVMITDPPYSDYVHANATSNRSDGNGTLKRDLGFESVTPELRDVGAAIADNVCRWSVIFSDHESTHLWRAAVPVPYIRMIPWIRWSQPQKSGDRPCSGSEAVLHFHPKGRKHWNGPGSLTHYAAKAMRGSGKHPTQKPLELALSLVSWFSDPGDVVVDPFAGAGTIPLACKLLGRSCVATEIDPTWCAYGNLRLDSLLDSDAASLARWARESLAATPDLPRPTKRHQLRTWERGQRRLTDVRRVLE
jgi:site-specific DNA-methyltransferase (adenine-specific)